MTHRLWGAATASVLACLAAGCGLGFGASPDPMEVCDGVTRSVGGCDPDQPTFAGQSCDAVAEEFGRQLDARLVPILAGNDVVDGEHKSVRMAHFQALLVTRANLHLQTAGIDLRCPAEAFLGVAERHFSDDLRSKAGTYLFGTGEPRAYEDWRADLLRTLSAVEDEVD